MFLIIAELPHVQFGCEGAGAQKLGQGGKSYGLRL